MPGPRPGTRIRLDQLVVDRGLARSKAEAQALILAGAIHLAGDPERRLSAGQQVDSAAGLVRDDGPRWASRGADKLLAALDGFGVAVTDLACLDAGASTGGFTDVLLDRGARRRLSPDRVREPVGGDDLAGPQKQCGEECTLATTREHRDSIPVAHLERPEDPILHEILVTGRTCCFHRAKGRGSAG